MSRSERPGQPETETVYKLETGKHYPVWNNGGWRRQPLSAPFPEPGHPVPSVLGCLPPSMGAQASPPAAWPGSRLTPCPPWTSPGPWEDAARPPAFPSLLQLPPGRGALVPGVLLAPLGAPSRLLPGQACSTPPTNLRGDSPTLPPPQPGAGGGGGGCAVSPNPHLPPEPRPSPPQREARAEPGVLTPPPPRRTHTPKISSPFPSRNQIQM